MGEVIEGFRDRWAAIMKASAHSLRAAGPHSDIVAKCEEAGRQEHSYRARPRYKPSQALPAYPEAHGYRKRPNVRPQIVYRLAHAVREDGSSYGSSRQCPSRHL